MTHGKGTGEAKPVGTRLRVLTLNVLNVVDRWPERRPLLSAGFAAVGPDIAALQEVAFPIDQDRLIAGTDYEVRRAAAWTVDLGNSLLVRRRLALRMMPLLESDRLGLGHRRSALRARLEVGGRRVRLFATHLHHVPADEPIRDDQVAQLVDWVTRSPEADVTIVMGDFNAEPDEAAALRMLDAGFRSGYAEAAGANPSITFPSGLQAPDRREYVGWPEGCIDYVWIQGEVAATSAILAFNAAAPDDPTLLPSDHFGVVVDLALG
jgi:endonuclease/exonuclease/phosphatase family metal-dependent hydrolase